MIESFHFLRPWCIVLLPFIGLIIWKLSTRTSQTNPWSNQVADHLKKFMIGEQANQGQRKRRQHILLSLLLGLLLVALLGPTLWKKQVSGVSSKPQVMILLDQSLSMLADDIKPSRTIRATHLILDLVEKMPEAAIGLIAYAGSAHPLVPITFTHEIIEQSVNNIDPKIMPSQGSYVLEALETAKKSLAERPESTLIWITDEIKPTESEAVVQELSNTSFKTIIIGIGTEKGAPIDFGNGKLMRDEQGQLVVPVFDSAQTEAISTKAGAQFYDQKELYGQKIKALTTPITAVTSNNTKAQESLSALDFDRWEDLGPWLIIPSALLFASLFRQGFLFVVALCLLSPFMSSDLQAQRADQKAWHAYQEQDYEGATQTDDHLIKGAALYQQQLYKEAAQQFAQATDIYEEGSEEAIQAYYNLGNAFAHTEQLEAALGAYNQALAWQKEHKDALFNKDIIEKMLQQEQEQSESEQDESKEESGEQDTSQPNESEKNKSADQSGEQDTEAEQNKAAQQEALEQALKDFKQEQQEEQEEEQEAAQADEQAAPEEQEPIEEASTPLQEKSGTQVKNHHLEAMELQPSGVLRNKMIRQYRLLQQQKRSNGR